MKTKIMKRIGVVSLALLLVAATVLGILTQGFTNWNFGNASKADSVGAEPVAATLEENSGINFIPVETVNNTSVKLRLASVTMNEDNVSPLSAPLKAASSTPSSQIKSSYTLTATFEPANASDQTVGWRAEFVNPDSAWAKNKKVSDYLTVTPTSTGALTATVTKKAAFGEQIKIIVTSDYDEEIYAETIADCAQIAKDWTNMTFGGGNGTFSNNCNVLTLKDAGSIPAITATQIKGSSSYDAYTLADTYTYKATITFTGEYLQTMLTNGFNCKGYDGYLQKGGTAQPFEVDFTDYINGTAIASDTLAAFGIEFRAAQKNMVESRRSVFWNNFVTAMNSFNGATFATIKIEQIGTYSTMVKEIEVKCPVGTFHTVVSSVTVTPGNIIL